jgi:hypothetical protein
MKEERRDGGKLARFLYHREGAGSERRGERHEANGVAGSEMGGRKQDGWLGARWVA